MLKKTVVVRRVNEHLTFMFKTFMVTHGFLRGRAITYATGYAAKKNGPH